jgi:hypothetical protein
MLEQIIKRITIEDRILQVQMDIEMLQRNIADIDAAKLDAGYGSTEYYQLLDKRVDNIIKLESKWSTIKNLKELSGDHELVLINYITNK